MLELCELYNDKLYKSTERGPDWVFRAAAITHHMDNDHMDGAMLIRDSDMQMSQNTASIMNTYDIFGSCTYVNARVHVNDNTHEFSLLKINHIEKHTGYYIMSFGGDINA